MFMFNGVSLRNAFLSRGVVQFSLRSFYILAGRNHILSLYTSAKYSEGNTISVNACEWMRDQVMFLGRETFSLCLNGHCQSFLPKYPLHPLLIKSTDWYILLKKI